MFPKRFYGLYASLTIALLLLIQCKERPPINANCEEQVNSVLLRTKDYEHTGQDSARKILYSVYDVAVNCSEGSREKYYLELIKTYRMLGNVDSCSKYLAICKAVGYSKKWKEELLNEEMWNQYYKGNTDSAIDVGNKIIQISTQKADTAWLVLISNNIFQFKQQSTPGSSTMALEAEAVYKMAAKVKDTVGQIMALRVLTNVNRVQGINTALLEYFNQGIRYGLSAVSLARASGQTTLESYASNDLSVLYQHLGTGGPDPQRRFLDSSIVFGELSLALKQKLQNFRGIINCYINLGESQLSLGTIYHAGPSAFVLAEDYLTKAEKLSDSISDVWLNMQAKLTLGRVYAATGREMLAADIFKETAEYGEKKDKLDFAEESYFNLAQVENKERKYKEAYDVYVKYSDAKDSIVRQANQSDLLELNTKYETEKLKAQSLVEINRSNERKKIIAFLLILIGAILFALIRIITEKNKLKRTMGLYGELSSSFKSELLVIREKAVQGSVISTYSERANTLLQELEAGTKDLFEDKVPLITRSERKRDIFNTIKSNHFLKIEGIKESIGKLKEYNAISGIQEARLIELLEKMGDIDVVASKGKVILYRRFIVISIGVATLNLIIAFVVTYFAVFDIHDSPWLVVIHDASAFFALLVLLLLGEKDYSELGY